MTSKRYSLKKFLLTSSIILTLVVGVLPFAFAETPDHPILYFFWGEGCPHCGKEEVFLEKLHEKYPELEMRWFETWNHHEFANLADAMRQVYEIKTSSIPMTFIGEWSFTGYLNDEETGTQIEEQVVECIQSSCIDAIDMIGPRIIVGTVKDEAANGNPKSWELYPATASSSKPQTASSGESPETQSPKNTDNKEKAKDKWRDLSEKIGLPFFTIVIAGLDGFNPCAMWVLTFLLTLVIYAKSRAKILLIGGIFVFASGLIYFVFMAGWLIIFKYIGYVKTLRIIVAVVAIVMGIINCKDFFFFKKGFSLTIPEAAQPKLFKKMRALVQTTAISAVILGTIVLAVTANMIELMCTAGFPAIYTRILTLQKSVSGFQHYLYLLMYNVVYVIPLAVIVGVFAWKMGGRKLTEKEGRILKLVGGVLMLALGIILLVKPQILMFG